jgi:phage terminase Nu1 subunit (DNA packaging protein)
MPTAAERFIGKPLLRKELAKALNVSVMALNTWEREGAPVEDVLNEKLEDAVAYLSDWRAENKRARFQDGVEADSDGSLQQRLLAAQIRDKLAAARAKEIANEVRLGELIEKEEVSQQVVLTMSVLNARIEQLTDEIRKELPADCREAVAQRVDGLLHLALKECAANMRRAGNGTA